MNKLLVTCPTRNRPQKALRMLESFYNTKHYDSTDIRFYISDEDPKLNEYKHVLPDELCVIGTRLYITNVFNVFPTLIEADYYSIINDDHIYKSQDWDKTLIDVLEQNNGWGIAYANDSFGVSNGLVGTPMMSRKMFNALGYFVLPDLWHLRTDKYWHDLAKSLNRSFYCKDVEIFHNHELALSDWQKWDDNYKWVYSKEVHDHDFAVYDEWLKNKGLEKDTKRVLEDIKNEC